MNNGSNGNGELKDAATSVSVAPATQQPDDTDGIRLAEATHVAAGSPLCLQTMRFTLREMGAVRGVDQLLRLNQKKGFDCQSCAWPSPG